MDISIERRPNDAASGRDAAVVVLAVAGRIDAETGAELRHAVAEELRRGGHAIRLDCAGVRFLSSAGIRVLFDVHRAAKTAGGTCLIGAASEPVARVLELTRLAPLLMESRQASGPERRPEAGPSGGTTAGRDLRVGRVVLVGLESSGVAPLAAEVIACGEPLRGRGGEAVHRRMAADAFGLGLAALADDRPLPMVAGEMVAAAGAVFHRSPQPFAAVDYSLAEGGLVPGVRFASGMLWHGMPGGRAGFEPADDEPAVRFDDLAAAVLAQSAAECLALVVVAEVHGLVGAELIRPLAEAAADDHPHSGDPAVAASWLSFSREPVHARRTAVIVGVVARGHAGDPWAGFTRPLAAGGPAGHAHAVVFPLRPLRRGVAELAPTIADLAASHPLAVMHLLGDPEPVLGSGQSELVRGCCWFAPLEAAPRPPEEVGR